MNKICMFLCNVRIENENANRRQKKKKTLKYESFFTLFLDFVRHDYLT